MHDYGTSVSIYNESRMGSCFFVLAPLREERSRENLKSVVTNFSYSVITMKEENKHTLGWYVSIGKETKSIPTITL